ncbi:carbon-nitrogen hydrolase family protein [Pacificibacter sp. AS14]|uniref:carbon-nitrogen hydrolase family protein n=1 Tax=Alphaproteobacteria TaxID=28211 RepID=UPI00317B6FEE
MAEGLLRGQKRSSVLEEIGNGFILNFASHGRFVHLPKVRIAAAQAPEIHKDIPRALEFLHSTSERAKAKQAHLLVFPEGFLQGYIVEEQQAREVAIDLSSQRFLELLEKFPPSGPMLVVGMIELADEKLYNTAIVVKDQGLIGRYRKQHLLPREVAFTKGKDLPVFEVHGLRFCINICYDTNFPTLAEQVSRKGAELIVCCANNMLKHDTAEKYKWLHNSVRGQRCHESALWLISSDVTGEREDYLALGPTAVLNPDGDVAEQLPLGQVGMLVFDLPYVK